MVRHSSAHQTASAHTQAKPASSAATSLNGTCECACMTHASATKGVAAVPGHTSAHLSGTRIIEAALASQTAAKHTQSHRLRCEGVTCVCSSHSTFAFLLCCCRSAAFRTCQRAGVLLLVAQQLAHGYMPMHESTHARRCMRESVYARLCVTPAAWCGCKHSWPHTVLRIRKCFFFLASYFGLRGLASATTDVRGAAHDTHASASCYRTRLLM